MLASAKVLENLFNNNDEPIFLIYEFFAFMYFHPKFKTIAVQTKTSTHSSAMH
jgi:hypothetical protein